MVEQLNYKYFKIFMLRLNLPFIMHCRATLQHQIISLIMAIWKEIIPVVQLIGNMAQWIMDKRHKIITENSAHILRNNWQLRPNYVLRVNSTQQRGNNRNTLKNRRSLPTRYPIYILAWCWVESSSPFRLFLFVCDGCTVACFTSSFCFVWISVVLHSASGDSVLPCDAVLSIVLHLADFWEYTNIVRRKVWTIIIAKVMTVHIGLYNPALVC